MAALKDRNHDVATDEKTRVEDQQREEAAKRSEQGVEWHPRLFRRVRGGPGGSEEGEEDLDWILNAEMLVVLVTSSKSWRSADCISDGPSPEIKIKQILAVYPILKGQSASDPLRHPSSQRTQPPKAVVEQEDLIDFGRPDENSASPQDLPQNKTVMQNNPAENSSSQHPLQPDTQPALVRVDTETDEVDQFVDAKP